MLLSGSQQKLAAVPVQRTLHYSFQGDRLHKNCFAIRKARGRGWNWCTSETNGTAANCTLIDEMFQVRHESLLLCAWVPFCVPA